MTETISDSSHQQTPAESANIAGEARELDWFELETLANKLIEMMRRDLVFDKEREGRMP